ncbi:nucleotidyltransferase domain-containing protein [Amycolatopsis sp. EV170708-02-1]|uniref:nucleotidyltransferase domain-containing protein n=1 Tax=Amycolatopsis sp. EV170708-02-1 TaxID=2919322 RepID=UPI001F0C1B2A|nr:nucleotidyltransferase domain-containing protein [Amycolatopsis sp. EV170708-02-1]UMP05048.1 nucleotidyltransferase domain-containing protein [Amycolatopsis sp. EV170708-02-1]
MDPVRIAREVVETRFPAARAAILGGSANTGSRTAKSDLDVVVFLDGPPAPYRETIEHDGVPVELFCHTPESYEAFATQETASRRSPLLHMCGEGLVLLDRDGFGQRTQAEAQARLRAGPPPLSSTDLEDHRYLITDLLDDLDGADDPDELVFVADRLLIAVAELILLMGGRWRSHGKWLLRRLREADPKTCRELLLGYRQVVCAGDPTLLRQVVAVVLDGVGGRLLVGYRRDAPTGFRR